MFGVEAQIGILDVQPILASPISPASASPIPFGLLEGPRACDKAATDHAISSICLRNSNALGPKVLSPNFSF
jgi:hypothetical protein